MKQFFMSLELVHIQLCFFFFFFNLVVVYNCLDIEFGTVKDVILFFLYVSFVQNNCYVLIERMLQETGKLISFNVIIILF